MVKKADGAGKAWRKRLGFDPATPPFVGRSGDIVIVVMGPTGAGKSTFIQKFTGDENVVVGNCMRSCTAEVMAYEAKLPDKFATSMAQRRLVLVDTPGFDDTHSSDVVILKKVVTWLAQCYNHQIPVAGIVYMHNITLNRMFGSLHTNLNMFQKVCGDASFPRVVITTTHWQKLGAEHDVGEAREKDLKANYWKALLDHGASVMRVEDNDGKGSKAIIECFLTREAEGQKRDALLIQKEIVDLEKSLPATKAGLELRYTLQELVELQKKSLAHELDEREKLVLEEKMKALQTQMRSLKLSFGDRFKVFFGL